MPPRITPASSSSSTVATPSSERAGAPPACPLCEGPGGEAVWQDDRARVILVDDPDYPGFTRVVLRNHVAEMTDLAGADRDHLMTLVWAVEQAQRDALAPDKINLASFGNVVPHLHWHVIPRWTDDRHFPNPVWGASVTGREAAVSATRERALARMPAYRAALATRLQAAR